MLVSQGDHGITTLYVAAAREVVGGQTGSPLADDDERDLVPDNLLYSRFKVPFIRPLASAGEARNPCGERRNTQAIYLRGIVSPAHPSRRQPPR